MPQEVTEKDEPTWCPIEIDNVLSYLMCVWLQFSHGHSSISSVLWHRVSLSRTVSNTPIWLKRAYVKISDSNECWGRKHINYRVRLDFASLEVTTIPQSSSNLAHRFWRQGFVSYWGRINAEYSLSSTCEAIIRRWANNCRGNTATQEWRGPNVFPLHQQVEGKPSECMHELKPISCRQRRLTLVCYSVNHLDQKSQLLY